MDKHSNQNMERASFKIALIYACFSALWILLSDQILYLFVKTPSVMTQIQMLKGWIFITISAFIIYFLLRGEIRRYSQTQAVLRKSELNYRLLANNATDVIFVLDMDLNYTYASPSVTNLLGYEPESVVGQPASMTLTPSSRDLVLKTFSKIKALTKAGREKCSVGKTLELEMQRKDGLTVWTEVKLSFILDGNKESPKILGVTRDINERKTAEATQKKIQQKLRESKDRFQKVFDTHIDAIFILDATIPPKIFECNPATETIFQYKRKELIGKTTDILHVDQFHLEQFQSALYPSLEKDEHFHDFKFKMKRKDGEVFPSEHIVLQLKNDEGDRTGWISIIRDLTEKEQNDARIQRAQKMESIGNLAGGIAHDFNNILAPIIGMSELLMVDLPPSAKEYENAKVIYNAGTRAGKLVKQILAFSRQSEHKLAPVKMQKILKEVLKLCRSTIPANIEIEQNIQKDCGSVLADATQLHQIGMNLVTNAYHAVQNKNGKISILLKEIDLEKKGISGLSSKSGRYIVLSVSDNGTGINPDMQEKIFEPYFTTKKQGKGTGLGLSVVYGIVKDHGGEITVESKAGKGSTFNIYLSVMKNSSDAEPAAENLEKNSPTGDERILFVDDEIGIAHLGKQMLERFGYKVTSFSDSIEALEAFKARPEYYDILVSDMSMPRLTGDQLAVEIKKIRPDIPIIICTGFSQKVDKEKAQKLGVHGFLVKPAITADLVQMVRKVLDEKKQ